MSTGQNRYLGCVINGYADGINDWWGSRSDTPSVCFGQPGVTNANATLVLNAGAAHVYDVRKGTTSATAASSTSPCPSTRAASSPCCPTRSTA